MERTGSRRNVKYLALMVVFLLSVNLSLGYLLMRQSASSIVSLMQTRMLDVSNTAAAMIDGDVLKSVTPADKGTEGYESIMRTLTYFQDNIDLKYIYCIRDMGDGTFTFGLDPTVEDPGEFGSPIVYTDALYKASQGTPAADTEHYEDAWGSFYSAYSPVFDSGGKVAGIIAVDFSAEWYDRQLFTLTWTTVIVATFSLLIGGAIVMSIISQNKKRLGSIQGRLNTMASTLMHEMGSDTNSGEEGQQAGDRGDDSSTMDELEQQIESMQSKLKTQIAQVHGQAYIDGLTGVKSKRAYLEAQKSLDEKIGAGEQGDFAIVVCDINGLKMINDTLGHNAGDEYIHESCTMICDIFSHSPVYRVGGDEFTAVLTGRDYENRKMLMHELHRRSAAHIATNDAVVSGGLSEFAPGQDTSVQQVFERADAEMYQEKMLLKSLGAITRDDESDASDRDDAYDDILVFNTRKHILIADDVELSRDILGDLLNEDYEIYYASDGLETMELLEKHKDEIALVLLDLSMPNMTGREVMARMQADTSLMSIPVIVLTVDQEAELDCLKLGAMDFIPKPYPDIDIIKARISKCIELSENRDLIRYTQRDKLTGLLNKDYFVQYVHRFDQKYADTAFDALVCDVNHFHSVADEHGGQFGNLVLRSIGIGIKKLTRRIGGIGCREGEDTFLVYCPHQDNHEKLLERFMADLYVDKDMADKMELRFGVFTNAEREPDVEERFACAKVAADSVESDSGRLFGLYEYR